MIGHNFDKGRLAIVDSRTGATLFDSADHPLGEVRDYVYSVPLNQVVLYGERKGDQSFVAGVKVSDGQLHWQSAITISKDPVWLGVFDDGLVLMYGKRRDEKRVVAAVDPEEGKVRWQKSGFLQHDVEEKKTGKMLVRKDRRKEYRIAPLIADSDSTVVVFATKDGPMRLDKTSGELLWHAKALAGNHPSPMLHADIALYVVHENNVVGISATDGRVLWKHKARFDLSYIELHQQGMLVWSRRKLDLLRLESGLPAWKDFVNLPEMTGWTDSLNPTQPLLDERSDKPSAPYVATADWIFFGG